MNPSSSPVALRIVFSLAVGAAAAAACADQASTGDIARIAILGCHRQAEPAPAIAACAAAHPDLVLWIGDNVYAADVPHLVFRISDAEKGEAEVAYRVNFSELVHANRAGPAESGEAARPAGAVSAGSGGGVVGRRADGTQMTPVNQVVDPAGVQIELPGLRPQVVAISPDGRLIATSGKTNEVVLIDPATNRILARVRPPAEGLTVPPTEPSDRNLDPDTNAIESYTGLVFSPDGRWLAMSNVHGSIKMFAVDGETVTPSHTLPLPPANAPQRAAEIPAGLAFSGDGRRLYVCGNLSNRLLELDAATADVLRTFPVGVAPFDVVLAGGKAFVSNLGGRRPGPGDLTGPAGKGPLVRVDPIRHTAAEGSVSVIDLETEKIRERLVGRHASALARSPDGRHVVCANSGDDSLTVLDAGTSEVLETVSCKRTPAELYAAMPNGLAFDPAGKRLYVTIGGQNAVAVLDWDPDERGDTRLLGLIPVGWFPGAVAFDAARGRVVVANIKGLPDRPRPQGDTVGFNTHQYHGSLSLVLVPDEQVLEAFSARVDRGIRADAVAAAALPPRPGVAPRAIPERIGEPSLIKHVVYIIKENRTFDQVLGDLPNGRGNKDLCIFGEAITPNQHALARQFVLLDNTYCCGILSADGHNWSTAAVANDYLEKSFAGFPRSYPDGMEDADNDALAWSPAGFIWDSCLRRGRTLRNYGEFMMPRVRWRDPSRQGHPGFAGCYAAWKAGPDQQDVIIASEPAVESLRPHSPRDTVGWDMSVPDQYRADFIIRELAEFEQRGEYPNLVIICLPQDHTSGTSPGCPTPAACMADNDLALGRIVEALSHSRFWPKMAIFAIEDDPQAGWDHISGYRTTAYVASPYARRGVTVSTQYNSTSILRTIGQILGLPPMNLFDASATPMFDCFGDTADLRPFTAVPVSVPLDEMNPDPAALVDPLLKAQALASAAMNFAEIDRAPEDLLNRVLWHAMRGSDEPYPEWAAGGEDEDEEHEHAAAEASAAEVAR
jgi:YVTN family beta-propeller protein